jgi:flagellar basal-body rod modification protein FlgD
MVAAISNASTSALTSSTTGTGQTTAQEQTDRFMKLLVAQLNNQDPMNPMDNAQMTSQIAQINTVSGIQQVNDTIKSIATQFASLQMMQGASMIGKSVLADGNTLSVKSGNGQGAFNLATDASSVTMKVYTPGGQLLDTVNLGAMGAGNHNVNWDSSKYTGTGAPKFTVTALQGTEAVTSSTLLRDTITSISSDAGTLNATLQSGTTVKYDTIKAIL